MTASGQRKWFRVVYSPKFKWFAICHGKQVQHDVLQLMHKVLIWADLGYICPISNIQNSTARSMLEQADALLLLDSGAVRP